MNKIPSDTVPAPKPAGVYVSKIFYTEWCELSRGMIVGKEGSFDDRCGIRLLSITCGTLARYIGTTYYYHPLREDLRITPCQIIARGINPMWLIGVGGLQMTNQTALTTIPAAGWN